MIGWRPPRKGEEEVELLDAGVGSREEVLESFRELDTVHRWLGGYRATFDPLDRFVPTGPAGTIREEGNPPGPLRVLDVAGGSGDFARRFVAWGRRRGRPVRVALVDILPLALGEARGESVRPVRADALALPFADRSVHLAHCSTFFHHLSTLHARDVLAEMCRVSAGWVVVNDLVRSRVAPHAFRLLSRALSTNRLIRHDGPLSLRKAFSPDELRAIARAVGVTAAGEFRWHLKRNFPYRMTLVGARIPDLEASG